MAASPGSMYQKEVLKKRPTSNLQSSLGHLSKSDRYKEKDIPLNSNPPGSPAIQRSNNGLRKFSQISAHSDASVASENLTDTNSNSTKQTRTPKNAIRAKHHQVRDFTLGKLWNEKEFSVWCLLFSDVLMCLERPRMKFTYVFASMTRYSSFQDVYPAIWLKQSVNFYIWNFKTESYLSKFYKTLR